MKQNEIPSLKNLSYNHLMKDLIENSVKDSIDNNLLTILIVDNYSSKILSSFVKMSDLLSKGISSIELISTKRYKNINYGAIYFISPSEESCNLLIKDFIDLENPSYNRIYLFFTHKLREDLLEKITTEGIIQHTILIKEFNLSFLIFDDNIFDLGWESGLQIFNCDSENESKLLNSLSHQIFTVCSTLDINPYIQYQNNSKLCKKLSNKLEDIFDNNKYMNNKKREGIVLLIDRSFDLISPLLHDYNYQSLCYDLLNIKNKRLEVNGKIIKLSNEDEFWNNYKTKHIAEVFEDLFKNFETYENNCLTIENNNLTFSEMANLLDSKSDYVFKIIQLINQLNLGEKIKELFNKNHIYELIELEQDIFSGKIKDNHDISSKIIELKQKLKNEDFIRLKLLFYLKIKENNSNEIIDNNLFKEIDNITPNLKYFINPSQNGQIIDNIVKNKISINNENIPKLITYKEIRVESHISSIAYKASNYLLKDEEFPYKKYKKEEIISHLDNSIDKKFLIIFNIGGLSYNEIASIESLKKFNKFNYKIFLGSTSIINAFDYINNLKNIDIHDEQKIKGDCFEKNNILSEEADCIINVKSQNNNNQIIDENLPSEKQKLLEDDDLIYI